MVPKDLYVWLPPWGSLLQGFLQDGPDIPTRDGQLFLEILAGALFLLILKAEAPCLEG